MANSALDFLYWLDWGRPDDEMAECWRWAHATYQRDSILSHEQVARRLAEFLYTRLMMEPDTAERAAVLSGVRTLTLCAMYLSSGPKPIRQALAVLRRLSLPYQDHPDYLDEWRHGSGTQGPG